MSEQKIDLMVVAERWVQHAYDTDVDWITKLDIRTVGLICERLLETEREVWRLRDGMQALLNPPIHDATPPAPPEVSPLRKGTA